MVAQPTGPQTEWIALGKLDSSGDLHHREGLNMERVAEYHRMFENGENPPPIKVHKATMKILGGRHRFFAAKDFHTARLRSVRGGDWRQELIEVEWAEDDTPDPLTAPALFMAATAAENRHNGEPLRRAEVYKVLVRIIREHGKEEAKKWAPLLNEPIATVEDLYRKLYPSTGPVIASRPKRDDNGAVIGAMTEEVMGEQAATQEQPPDNPTAERPRFFEPPVIDPEPYTPPIGSYRTTRPPILGGCRTLREAIKEAHGDFTEMEQTEMLHTFQVLRDALNR